MNNQSSDFESQLRKLAPAPTNRLVEETFYRAGWEAAMKSLQQVGPACRAGLRGPAATSDQATLQKEIIGTEITQSLNGTATPQPAFASPYGESLARQAEPTGLRVRNGISFAAGLLCGLLCCVALMTVWNFQSDTASNERVATAGLPKQETVLVVDDVAAVGHVTQMDDVRQKDDLVTEQLPQTKPIDFFATITSILPWHSPRPIDVRNLASMPVHSLSVAARSQWNNMVLSESSMQRGRISPASQSDVADRAPMRAFPMSEAQILDLL